MKDRIFSLVGARQGHFAYESGHHGSLWFDLETLCRRPSELQPIVEELGSRLERYRPDVICGPLVEGAFVAMMVAGHLGCEFAYANRFAPENSNGLFPVEYRVPASLHAAVRGRRVAIANDVINAGSAVRGAYADLVANRAEVVGVGALLVLGGSFDQFARDYNIPVEALARMPNELWMPDECPLCRRGVELQSLAIA